MIKVIINNKCRVGLSVGVLAVKVALDIAQYDITTTAATPACLWLHSAASAQTPVLRNKLLEHGFFKAFSYL